MKRILLTLACAFLLSGCLAHNEIDEPKDNTNQTETPDNTNEKPNNETGEETGEDLPEENDGEDTNNDDQNDTGDDSEITGDTGDDEPGQNDENNENDPGNAEILTTKTVNFYNGGFTNSSLDQEKSRQNFVSWFNNGDDLLTSINYSGYSQLNYIGNAGDDWKFSTLILGSSSQDGNITFNFSKSIKSVKINIQGYCKRIDYPETHYNVDTNSVFYLDGDKYDLSVSPGYTELLEKQDVTKTYETPTTSINIQSEGGRVFVHSMELSYIQN